MKKFLSIILALTMILSSAVFAAPIMVDTVETAAEEAALNVDEEVYASTMNENDYGTLVYDISFDTDETAFGKSVLNYGSVNTPANFPAAEDIELSTNFTTSSISDGKAVVQSSTTGFRKIYVFSETSFPEGEYTIEYSVKNTNSATGATHYPAAYALGDADIGNFGTTVSTSAPAVYSEKFVYQDGFVDFGKVGSTVNDQHRPASKLLALGVTINVMESATFEIDYIKVYYTPFETTAPIIDITFDTAEAAFGAPVANYGSVNTPDNFPAAEDIELSTNFTTSSISGGKAVVQSSAAGHRRINVYSETSFPEGEYTIEYSVKNTYSATGATHYPAAYALGDADIGNFGTTVSTSAPAVYSEKFVYQDGFVDFGKVGSTVNDQHRPASKLLALGVTIDVRESATFEIDYIRIYYSKSYTVSFDGSGETAQTLESVKVDNGKLDVSEYSFDDTADKLFCGWADENGSAVFGTIDVTEDTVLYAVWENKVDAEKGTLAYYISFDTDEASFGKAVDNYGRVNPIGTFPSADSIVLDSSFTTSSISDGKAVVKAASGFRKINVFSQTSFPEGKYTIEYSITNTHSDTGLSHNTAAYVLGDAEIGHYGTTVSTSAPAVSSERFEYKDGFVDFGKVGSTVNDQHRPASKLLALGVTINVSESATFEINYVKVYYKAPVEVTVTFDGADITDEIIPSVKVTEGSTIDLTQYSFSNVENYIFKGWQDKDGNKLSGTIKVDEDITLTSVWTYTGVTPLSYAGNSIRVTEPQGIRFKSAVVNTVKTDVRTTEYGFIVTLERRLGERDAEYLTFEQTDIAYEWGVNYGYDTELKRNVDRIFDTDENLTYFTAVIFGIIPSKDNYEEQIIARPYIKYDGETIYGKPMSRSVLDVAKTIRDNDYKDLNAAGRQVIEDILEICGEEI